SVVEQRYHAVMEVLAGIPVTEVAARYRVSRQSAHTWVKRYREGGLGAPLVAWLTVVRVGVHQLVEFGPDCVGVGVAEFFEDRQGLLPGSAGGGVVPSGEVGVAEVVKGDGFRVVGVEFAPQADGLLVAGDGLGVVAKVVVGVAEAVEGGRFAVAVTQV